MTPSHTNKEGKRYRYYVTHPSAMIETGSIAWRISAPEVERIVVERLSQWLQNRSAILNLVGNEAAASALSNARAVATEFEKTAERPRLLAILISTVAVGTDQIVISLDRAGVAQMLGTKLSDDDVPLRLIAETTRVRQGKDVRMVVRDEHDRSAGTVNRPLLALISEAQELHDRLLAMPQHNVPSLADALGKCRRRSAMLLRIALLAPDIVASCIAGTQPVSLTTKMLLNADLPISWQAQRVSLGFA